MEIKSAIELINNLSYRPGWKIEAEDYTNRFEGAVIVKFTFPAYHTERNLAREGYPSFTGSSWAKFPIIVGKCQDDTELYRCILNEIVKIELHEAREFLRVAPTYWAPFHPHRIDGMERWGDVQGDLKYGVC